eukprot:scaffold15922_cov111-Isochrysis_galbana.AAC.2
MPSFQSAARSSPAACSPLAACRNSRRVRSPADGARAGRSEERGRPGCGWPPPDGGRLLAEGRRLPLDRGLSAPECGRLVALPLPLFSSKDTLASTDSSSLGVRPRSRSSISSMRSRSAPIRRSKADSWDGGRASVSPMPSMRFSQASASCACGGDSKASPRLTSGPGTPRMPAVPVDPARSPAGDALRTERPQKAAASCRRPLTCSRWRLVGTRWPRATVATRHRLVSDAWGRRAASAPRTTCATRWSKLPAEPLHPPTQSAACRTWRSGLLAASLSTLRGARRRDASAW